VELKNGVMECGSNISCSGVELVDLCSLFGYFFHEVELFILVERMDLLFNDSTV
jgi:hypothetical protein